MQHDPLLASIVFVLVRALAILLPPIPGAVLDIPAVQVFGWRLAFVLSETGTMLGALGAFAIGRRMRQTGTGRIAMKLLRIHIIRDWERRLPPGDRFLAWVAMRLPSNAAFDYISYAAGLTDCSWRMFFWSTLLGNIPIVLAFFYLAGLGFQTSWVLGWAAPLALLGLVSVPVSLRLRRQLTNQEGPGRK